MYPEPTGPIEKKHMPNWLFALLVALVALVMFVGIASLGAWPFPICCTISQPVVQNDLASTTVVGLGDYCGGSILPIRTCQTGLACQFKNNPPMPGEAGKCAARATSTKNLNSTTTSTINSSNWQTYRNDEFGFSLKYRANQLVHTENGSGPDIVYVTNDSPVTYDPAADIHFSILVYRDPNKFFSSMYDSGNAKFDDIYYSPVKNKWVVASGSQFCPIEKTNNQGAPYYIIQTGIHAGANIQAYITNRGLLIFTGNNYYDGEKDKFIDDTLSFDSPQSILKVGCAQAQ